MALPPDVVEAERESADFRIVVRVESVEPCEEMVRDCLTRGLLRGVVEESHRQGWFRARPKVGERVAVRLQCWFWDGSGPPGEDRLVAGGGREPGRVEVWGRMEGDVVESLSFAPRHG
jgi:hypothetical protein